VIAFIEGTLAEVLVDGAIFDVGGVGYRALMPASAVARLPAKGKKVRLHTSMQVREDSMTLYGFTSTEERDLFETLITVNGIGPKGGLAVLGVHSPEALRKALAAEDLDALTLIPGVGKKTAARMILELREKLALPDADGIPAGGAQRRAAMAEVKGALLHLGYTPAEARQALERVAEANGHDEPVEGLLKRALKELAKA
jgi:Holliday junction DNA helicase RuvA